jgi:cell wall assembly regulator SMI1
VTAGEVVDAWRDLCAALQGVLPEPTARFLPPAEDAVRRLEDATGHALTEELRAYLAVTGGQDDPDWANGPFGGAHFLTPDEMLWFVQEMPALFDDEDTPPVRQPSPYSREVWSRGWVPVLGFEGDTWVVDLDPGEEGVVGQVFFRPNVPDLGPPVAGSLTEFFARATAEIGAGHFTEDTNTLWFDEL